MKKIFFIILFLYPYFKPLMAQSPMEIIKERQEKQLELGKEYNKGKVDTTHRYFYKTYDDFRANKPVTYAKYVGKRNILFDGESVLVLEDDIIDYKKIKELKFWGFIDEQGQLERIFNNHCYFVLDSGKICLYVKAIDAEMSTDKNGNISIEWRSENPSDYKDYISEGLNAPIIDFNDKKFMSLTSSHPEVFEQYQAEAIDNSAKNKRSLLTFKIKKYIRQFNQLN